MGDRGNSEIESDFIRRIKQGDVPWMCRYCLKRKERDKPCECEKESNHPEPSIPESLIKP